MTDAAAAAKITSYRKNQGRVYKCGSVPPNSNKSFTVPLIQYLCTIKNRNYQEAAWRRRILRGQISVNGNITKNPDCALPPESRVSYHRAPWIEPMIKVVHGPARVEANIKLEEPPPPLPYASYSHDGDMHYFLAADTSGFDDEDPHTLRVIYRDEHLMAVHKPSGLPTMPSQTYFEYSVLNALRSISSPATRTKEDSSYSVNFLAPPQPVHRLGVGTSGVLLVAISLEARHQLTAAIRNKQVKKVYRALVQGAGISDNIKIDCPIGPVPFPIGGGTIHAACPGANGHNADGENGKCNKHKHNGRQIIDDDNAPAAPKHNMEKAKDALSFVRVVRRNIEDDTAVVEVEIPTGRPHQIRIHMAYAGHPLVGDPLYLPGGIPDSTMKLFPSRMKEDEDMDTDDEEECVEENASHPCRGSSASSDSGVMRVTLPRDCGYSLHAYQITLEHPMRKSTGERKIILTAKPPQHLGDLC